MKLTAKSQGRNDRHALVGVFQDGLRVGVLAVEAAAEQEVLGIINDRGDLLAAAEAALAEHNDPDSRSSLSYYSAVSLRAAIAKAQGKEKQ